MRFASFEAWFHSCGITPWAEVLRKDWGRTLWRLDGDGFHLSGRELSIGTSDGPTPSNPFHRLSRQACGTAIFSHALLFIIQCRFDIIRYRWRPRPYVQACLDWATWGRV